MVKDTVPPSCPIARGLARVGDRWSMLIMRDAVAGLRRFDEFEESLDIAPNTLTSRLKALVADGLLERRRYSDRPPRFEYVPTERGRDLRLVLFAFMAWGNKHLAPEGPSLLMIDSDTGAPADPMLVDGASGRSLLDSAFVVGPGPAAGDTVKAWIASRATA